MQAIDSLGETPTCEPSAQAGASLSRWCCCIEHNNAIRRTHQHSFDWTHRHANDL